MKASARAETTDFMSMVHQFQPTASGNLIPTDLIGGARTGTSILLAESMSARPPIKMRKTESCEAGRLKLKHHQHELGGLIESSRTGLG